MIKASCILACQVFPSPGLLVCGPGSCLSSLGSETNLLAYLQGLQPPGAAASGTGYPASLGNAFWAGMAAVAKWVRNPQGCVWAWG